MLNESKAPREVSLPDISAHAMHHRNESLDPVLATWTVYNARAVFIVEQGNRCPTVP